MMGVCGYTESVDFPTKAAYQSAAVPDAQGNIPTTHVYCRFSHSGTLLNSTYFQGATAYCVVRFPLLRLGSPQSTYVFRVESGVQCNHGVVVHRQRGA